MKYLVIVVLTALATVEAIYGFATPVYEGAKIVRLHRMSDGTETDIRAWSGYRIPFTMRELPFARVLLRITGADTFDFKRAVLFCDQCGVTTMYDQGAGIYDLHQVNPKEMPKFVHWWGLRTMPKFN